MIIHTRDFGQVDVPETNFYTMLHPIFGFEEYRRFALIKQTSLGEAWSWLQSSDEPSLCFILFDPTPLAPQYAPTPPVSEFSESDHITVQVLCSVPENLMAMTVNLKSPLFINETRHEISQIILEQDYPVRFPLMKEGQ